jgi:hypothetical protein
MLTTTSSGPPVDSCGSQANSPGASLSLPSTECTGADGAATGTVAAAGRDVLAGGLAAGGVAPTAGEDAIAAIAAHAQRSATPAGMRLIACWDRLFTVFSLESSGQGNAKRRQFRTRLARLSARR